MNTAIIYVSRHGTTEKIARMIASGLEESGRVTLIDLNLYRNPSLEEYDTVVLGTSIHMGRPAKAMQCYVTETANKNVLEKKRVGLVMCCMHPDEKQRREQFEHAFPEYLHRHAVAAVTAGGEFLAERMKWHERMIIKKVAGSAESVNNIDADAIADFIAKMKR